MGQNNNTNCAPKKDTIGTVFAPYFKARYQNYENITSTADFYSKMPSEWVAYQNAFVRQWDEWSRGFVPSLHRGNFFSLGMGKTVCDIMVRECMRGGYRFAGENDGEVEQASKWATDTAFGEMLIAGFENANRLGNNIVRLNLVSGKGEVYASSHGVDRTYFAVNSKGKIIKARFFDFLSYGTAKDGGYFTIEDRICHNGKNYYRVAVQCYNGTSNHATWGDIKDLTKLDEESKNTFEELYGDIEPNTWYSLPFNSLGCYNWRNMEGSATVSGMNGFTDSTLHTSLDILYSIDYNFSNGQLDQYFGKTRVMIPKPMTQKSSQKIIHNGMDFGEAMVEYKSAPLEDEIYSQVDQGSNITDKPMQPLFIQPNLRAEEHKYIRDADLELLASKVGLSSSTVANHLSYFNPKTATQVESENDTTAITVENKRSLCNFAIDDLLKDVAEFYGWGDIDLIWNLSGKGKKEDILFELKNGLLPLEDAIKSLHPELTEVEISKRVEKLKAEKQSSSDINSIFGLGDEH